MHLRQRSSWFRDPPEQSRHSEALCNVRPPFICCPVISIRQECAGSRRLPLSDVAFDFACRHPDKNNGSEESTEKFKQVSAAYSRLTSPTADDDMDGFDPSDIFTDDLFDEMGMHPLFMQFM